MIHVEFIIRKKKRKNQKLLMALKQTTIAKPPLGTKHLFKEKEQKKNKRKLDLL